MERGTTIILVSTDSALIRQYKFMSKEVQAKFYLQRQVSMRKKGANIPRIFDGNSIKANQTLE